MAKKEKIKIDFADFWPNFLKEDNYFYHLLKREFDITITEDNPDLVFHSVDYSGKKEHEKYDFNKTKKIFYTGENVSPDFSNTHAALSFKENSENNYRLPLWALHINWFNVPYKKNRDQSYLLKIDNLLEKNITKYKKRSFCSFIASKPSGKRNEFIPKFNDIKKIDCAGRLFNNTKKNIKGRGDQKWKINYLKKYKFNVCFENSSTLGYVTEKIIQSMYVNSIPIYWGAEDIENDFNTKSFISYHDYENDEEFIEKILKIDNNNDQYVEMLSEPWFNENKIPESVLPKNVLKFIISILNKT